MKIYLAIILFIYQLGAFAASGVVMNLDGDNFPTMIEGSAQKSVDYTVQNFTKASSTLCTSNKFLKDLPVTATAGLNPAPPVGQNCIALASGGSATLTVTLNPTTPASIQDVYQTGPLMYLSIAGIPVQILEPLDNSQKISVKVFSKWAATGKTPLPASTNLITSANGTIYASQGNELYSLDTADNEWSKAYEPATGATIGAITASVTASDGTIYVGTLATGVYKPNPDADEKTHWLAEGTGLGTVTINKLFYYKSKLYAATDVGLYSLEDSTWTKDAAPAPQVNVNDVYVTGTIMYVATNTGVEKFDGTTWTAMTGIAEPVNALTRDANGNLFAATNGSGISELPSGKTEWEVVTTTGLPNTNITGIKALTDNGVNYLFAFPSGDTGVYISQDAGKTWVEFNGAAIGANTHVNQMFRSGFTYYIAANTGVFSRGD